MQAARPRQYALTGVMFIAVALSAVLTLTLVLTSYDSSTGLNEPVMSAPAVNRYDQMTFLESNVTHIPNAALQVRSAADIVFWEDNTIRVPRSAPLRSFAETALWEANTMQIP